MWCSECNQGRYLNTATSTCDIKSCTCSNGVGSTGLTCPHHTSHHCVRCDAGYYLDAKTHQCRLNVCNCANGEATTGVACKTHGDDQCSSCEAGFHATSTAVCEPNVCQCPFGEPVSGAACKSHNVAMCESCSDPLLHVFIKAAGACAKRSVCTKDVEYEVHPGDPTTDRRCAAILECDWTLQFALTKATATSNTICAPTTPCKDSEEFEFSPPTQKTNRVCRQKVCKCAHGEPARGSKCLVETGPRTASTSHERRGTFAASEMCISCFADHHLVDGKCRKNKVCSVGTIESMPPTLTTNRECVSIQCSCEHGEGATYQEGCQVHALQKCVRCSDNHYLGLHDDQCHPLTECRSFEYEHLPPTEFTNRDCREKTCKCKNGIAAKGVHCFKHDHEFCVACKDDHALHNVDHRCYAPGKYPLRILGGFVFHDLNVTQVQEKEDKIKKVIHDKLQKDNKKITVTKVELTIRDKTSENVQLRRLSGDNEKIVEVKFLASGYGDDERTSDTAAVIFMMSVDDGTFTKELRSSMVDDGVSLSAPSPAPAPQPAVQRTPSMVEEVEKIEEVEEVEEVEEAEEAKEAKEAEETEEAEEAEEVENAEDAAEDANKDAKDEDVEEEKAYSVFSEKSDIKSDIPEDEAFSADDMYVAVTACAAVVAVAFVIAAIVACKKLKIPRAVAATPVHYDLTSVSVDAFPITHPVIPTGPKKIPNPCLYSLKDYHGPRTAGLYSNSAIEMIQLEQKRQEMRRNRFYRDHNLYNNSQ